MRIGVNSTGIKYYTEGRYFADGMKLRPSFNVVERSNLPTKPWEGERPTVQVVRDENGYPIGMCGIDLQSPRKAFRTTPFMHNKLEYDSGTWTLIFDGTGQVAVVSNRSHRWQGDKFREPGVRHTFDVTPDAQGIMIFIEESDPLDHVRNIRIYPPGQYADGMSIVDGGESGRIWHPKYLERIAPYSHVRSMDFTQTNGSKWNGWENRVKPDQIQTGDKAIALEFLAELSNTTGKDLWYCIPHTATLDDCFKIGEFFRENLNENIRIFVEPSNELWNGSFSHTNDIKNAGTVPGSNWQQRFANKYVPMMQSFREGWGGQDERLILVIAWQNANLWWTERTLEAVAGIDSTVIGMISVAPYFGHGFHKEIPTSMTLDEARAKMSEMMPAELERVLTRRLAEIRLEWSKRLGRRILLGLYEAGQHFYLGREPSPDALMMGLQETPEMEAAYLSYLSRIEALGIDEVSMFTLSGDWSKHGAWGMTETLRDDPMLHAKSRAVHRFLAGDRLELVNHPDPVEEFNGIQMPQLSQMMTISDGDPGYLEIGSWSYSNQGGHGGTCRVAPKGDIADRVALWHFPTKKGKEYEVWTTYTAADNRASNAKYVVRSDEEIVASVIVNQKEVPAELELDGFGWKKLTNFIAKGEVMSVHLDNKADGFVVADSVMIQEINNIVLPELSARMSVNDGDPGYEEDGNWQNSTHGGYSGSSRLSQEATAKARWNLPAIPGKSYRISANWSRASNRSRSATYVIRSGDVELDQVTVDQTIAPDDFDYANGKWKTLSVVIPTGDSMTIELTSNDAGRYMVADGILVEETDLIDRSVVLYEMNTIHEGEEGSLKLIFEPN